ncbi:HMCN [Mytilus edulis]|uniref:HMCN n=1 Tax=Mytilus edulis TaxID=6550 RepID=A0A8S3QTI6_MYTED|nr:HMCN [Mytilus edulis]
MFCPYERVAGIVAAKKNRRGTIGIAFGAEIADVSIASTAVFDTFDATLLKHRSDAIDVTTDIGNGETQNFNQNSAAAPMVSGAVALALSAKLNRDPTHFVVDVNGCAVDYIEHVEISLKVNHPHAGQIQWVLVSPYGTKSTILPGRGLDPTTNMDITVLTVQLWEKIRKDNGDLNQTLFNGEWSQWSQCTASCGQGTKRRHRQCSNSRYCTENTDETIACRSRQCQLENSQECPTTLESRCVEQCSNNTDCYGRKICCNNGCGHTCEWSLTDIRYWRQWSAWSHCSQTCGYESRTRTRVCSRQGRCRGDRQETQSCNLPACRSGKC